MDYQNKIDWLVENYEKVEFLGLDSLLNWFINSEDIKPEVEVTIGYLRELDLYPEKLEKYMIVRTNNIDLTLVKVNTNWLLNEMIERVSNVKDEDIIYNQETEDIQTNIPYTQDSDEFDISSLVTGTTATTLAKICNDAIDASGKIINGATKKFKRVK